jgi:hypothetical protein
MATIQFIRNNGGLGRPLPGLDYVSGMVFYQANAKLPSGFTTGAREKKFLSLAEAEAAGITSVPTDETTATGGNVNITGAGTAGDIVKITINEGDGPITIGQYTIQAGDNATAIAVGLRASINDIVFNPYGYTAGGSTTNVAITAPVGLGDLINGGSKLAFNAGGGTSTATVTQFTGGVAGNIDVFHYQISEYFRMQPKGVLYVGIYDNTNPDLAVIETLQNFAGGEIRQVGVFNHVDTFTSGDLTALQTSANNQANIDRPMSVLYAANMTGLTPATFPNITALTAPRVSAVVSGDGASGVRKVFNAKPYTVAALGAALGTVSFASVHESMAWVGKFNTSDGTNLETVKVLPSTQWPSVTTSLQAQLSAYGYIYLKKYDGLAGSYWDNQKTAVSNASDFARISNNRVMDKAIRLIRLRLLPLLSSPLYINTDGTLSEATIAVFSNECDKVIGGRFNDVAAGQMVIDGEISAGRVIINPAQNVLSTGRVDIAVEIIPVGEAETIRVTIGFVAQFNQ